LVHKLEELPKAEKQTASAFIAFLLAKSKATDLPGTENITTALNNLPKTGFGCLKGMFKLAPDFDEPLQDLRIICDRLFFNKN